MISKQLILTNEQGFHIKPASEFTNAMAKFECSVTLRHNGNDYNAKSLLNIMSACIKSGSELEIICNGTDENAALEKAVEFINCKPEK